MGNVHVHVPNTIMIYVITTYMYMNVHECMNMYMNVQTCITQSQNTQQATCILILH